jgi:membrane-bound serine protease (ClpP class)
MDNLFLILGLLVLGYLSLAIEVFLVPGFGVFGLGALVLLGVGCFLAFSKSALFGGLSLLVSLLFAIGGIVIFPRTRYGKKFVLKESQNAEDGYVGVEEGLDALLGMIGETESPLRPSGIVTVGGKRIDAVSDGEFLPPGKKVRVVKVEGYRLVVEPAENVDSALS